MPREECSGLGEGGGTGEDASPQGPIRHPCSEGGKTSLWAGGLDWIVVGWRRKAAEDLVLDG